MSAQLRKYLFDAYIGRADFLVGKHLRKDYPIQVDDQDDNDQLENFCNIFVTIPQRDTLTLEMTGAIPLSRDIADIAEIYAGTYDPQSKRLAFTLSVSAVEAIADLATKIRETAMKKSQQGTPDGDNVAARTISSLLRLVRVLREYRRVHSPQ